MPSAKNTNKHDLRRSRITQSQNTLRGGSGLPFGQIAKAFFLTLLVFVIAWSSFFVWKARSVGNTISSPESLVVTPAESDSAEDRTQETASHSYSALAATNNRINILLLGRAGEGRPGANLTDTIMVASVDQVQKKVALLSLPRDLYVNIPDTNLYTKINSVYQHGLSQKTGITPLVKTIEAVTGQQIHYYLVSDFDGFIDVVDAVDGINVMVHRDVFDTRYPGPNYSYETFELSKGLQHMNGSTALKYVRYRHGDPEGDFGRAKRQQQVMQAVKNKVFTLRTFLNPFTVNELLKTLEEHVRTNIATEEINDFLALLGDVDTQNITTVVVDAWQRDSLLRVAHFYHGPTRAFGLVPRAGNYSEIHERAENIFNLEELERRADQIAREDATVVVMNHSGNAQLPQKISRYLTDSLGFANVVQHTGSGTERAETIALDYTDGKKPFSLDELLKKIPATLSTDPSAIGSINPSSETIVVVLGTDLIDAYIYDEASLEELNTAPRDQHYLDVIEKK